MTGAEAVVLGYILVAFVIFGVTLAWVSSDGRRQSASTAANDEARRAVAMRKAA